MHEPSEDARLDPPTVLMQLDALRRERISTESPLRIVLLGDRLDEQLGTAASHARALRSLGHRVVEVDLSRHPAAVRGAAVAEEGRRLVPEALEQVVRRARPTLLVVVSASITLDDAARGWLRDRSIRSVGAPESAAAAARARDSWLRAYDLCLAPSEALRADWEARAARATAVMPMSVDRASVLQRLPAWSGVVPDLLLLDDARDRQPAEGPRAVLDAVDVLRDQVELRVEGSGWPIPGAGALESGARLRLARAVPVHLHVGAVGVPLSRGAFESVAAGAALLSLDPGSVGEHFDLGAEVEPIDRASEVPGRLAILRDDPGRREAIRRRAFARLVRDHLLERRWLDVLGSRSSMPGAADGAVERQEEPGTRSRTVILSGFFGARNRGDDLLLESLTTALEAHDPEVRLVVAGIDPAVIEEQTGYPSFHRDDLAAVEQHASRAAAIVLGPGGLWHDYSIAAAGGVAGVFSGAVVSPAHLAQLPLTVRAYGGALHVYGMGVGPLVDDAARAVVRLTGQAASSITLRDRESEAWLEGIAADWSARPEIVPDAVYSLDLSDVLEAYVPAPYIVLNLRPWQDDAEVRRLRAVVRACAEELGVAVVGLPMQPIDVGALRGTAADAEPWPRLMPLEASTAELLGLLEGASAVVSMRLHANLLAHRLGTPAIGLSYDDKVRLHFEQVDRADWVLPLDADAARISALLQAAIRERTVGERASGLVRQMEAASDAALSRFAGRVLAGAPRPEPLPVLQHDRGGARPRPLVQDPAAEGGIDLDAAIVTALRPSAGGGPIEAVVRRSARGTSFGFADAAPRRGDAVEWALTLPAARRGRRVLLELEQGMRERPELREHVAYSVHLDGTQLFQQDLAAWRPRNSVWVTVPPSSQRSTLLVRLEALRDCPSWNWGVASMLTVVSARAEPFDGAAELRWGASSPAARPEPLEPERAVAQPLARPRAVALVAARNALDPGRHVGHDRRSADGADTIAFQESGPRRGDQVVWTLPIDGEAGRGVRIGITIVQQYGERPGLAGHIRYAVLVGDRVLLTQDIVAWRPANHVWIAVGADERAEATSVQVRLEAMVDCPPWSWGAATALTIAATEPEPWDGTGGLAWGASSPMARRPDEPAAER